MDLNLALALLGVVLGLIGLLIGFYHVHELKHAVCKLVDVQNAMSTQYLGPFPDFIDKVIGVISGSKHELVVFCDFPGYAKFSTPAKASEYQYALDQARLRESMKVDVTCLSSTMRQRYRLEQFTDGGWDEWCKVDTNQKRLTSYMAATGWKGANRATAADLRDELSKADDLLLLQPVFRAARQVDLHMPMFFWIADNTHAVFSIPTLSHTAIEQGFYTTDMALIRGLREMHERYCT